jgi:EAL domain-containing protein (putative c-di-GMP-specific phosphodiesterase class I)
VVAEGVETDEQLGFLRAHGCDQMQGFCFSRPVEASALEALLRGCPGREERAVANG